MDKVTHFEIPADNMKRAQKFLKSVFGWKFEDWDGDYAHVETVPMDKNWEPKEKGAINGALFKRESKKDQPLLVITVPSISKYLDKVKKAKGRIVTGKQEAGEWGYWAEIMDTEGNIFELWEDKK
jgi:predicted enzyme related to lactoylglutathione lyase